jgi:predicted PurR-regulated permease PerM
VQKPEDTRNGQWRRSLVAITEPKPAPATTRAWTNGTQAAIIGIFIILFIGALYLARPVLLPATSAFVVTMMLGPLSAKADRLGVPPIVTAIVLWLLVVVVFYQKAPEIGKNIQQKMHVLDAPLTALQNLRDTLLPSSDKGGIGVDIISFVQPVMSIIAPGIGQVLIFFGTLFFMLLGRSGLRRSIVSVFAVREAKLRALKIMNDIEHNLTGYLSLVSIINICIGIGSGVVAWVTGMPDPLAWAVLGFLLNYIAYIGALIMEAALFMVALVTFPSLTHALLPPILYFMMATLEGHFITPSLVGHRLTLNPLAVILSLVFWTWLWGPVGAFLSAPLLIMGLVAISHLFPRTEPTLPE